MSLKSCLLLTILITSFGISVLSGDLETTPVAESDGWTIPDCDRIKGTSAVSYTTDDFLTMADSGTLNRTVYTYGLTALQEANTLVAAPWDDFMASLLISEDAGCSWQRFGHISECSRLKLATGPEGIIYAWSPEDTDLYRIEGDVITRLPVPSALYGIAIDPEDPMHIRIGGYKCQLWESYNGGTDFSAIGESVNTSIYGVYTVDFDPANMDCALCGTRGGYRTTDGGNTWTRIIPFDVEDEDFTYTFAFSPVDSRRVWVRGKLESSQQGPAGIFVSDDNGASFSLALPKGVIVEDQNGIERVISMPNIPTWAPHPENKDVLYHTYGSPYPDFDPYGTDFIRFDLSTGDIGLVHRPGLHGINAIAFNPVDPSVIYLGLENQFPDGGPPMEDEDEAGESMKMVVSPNPFNPSATINFSLPEAAQVKLNVYNIAGQKVATVVNNEYMTAGEHTVSWDAGRFASGIYLARIETGTLVETTKMVLLK